MTWFDRQTQLLDLGCKYWNADCGDRNRWRRQDHAGARNRRTVDLPHIELDAINWQTGWRDLDRHDPNEFVRRVMTAIQAEAWVLDGGYNSIRDILYRRATHLVWLDYERPVIMARVIRRSLLRAILHTELWAGTGNRERWRHLLRRSHPIRWAWSTWRRRRRETAERVTKTEYAHRVVLRLRRPREARQTIELLAGAARVKP